MSHALANHNEDINQLVEKGYAVGMDSDYLVVRDVPYLNEQSELSFGAIVTKLSFVKNDVIGPPDDHQIFFCGSHPHNIDGSRIANLGGGATQLQLADTSLVVERSFSNKPPEGFSNFFDKIENYIKIISGPAMQRDDVTPLTHRHYDSPENDSVFKFRDTLTSRAEIGDLTAKFENEVVVIIGLGGTGGYLLDFLVKTPVREIRGFDADHFLIHNAFRSPGQMNEDELGVAKAAVYNNRYKNFRTGLTLETKYIDSMSHDEVAGATFAFVCVDKGTSRSGIFDLLIEKRIPFIDVGMGLNRKRGSLSGMARTTYYHPDQAEKLREMQLAETADDPDDLYRNTVQISELNALNASLAILRYKQLRGFYQDDAAYNHFLMRFNDLHIVGEQF